MAPKWIELATGSLEQKRQYKKDRARIEALPEPYRSAAKALLRYVMYQGGVTDGATAVTMVSDLVDLWERAAVDGTPVRAIVGEDPVDFAETFTESYVGKHWIDKERRRLTADIDRAAEQQEGPDQ